MLSTACGGGGGDETSAPAVDAPCPTEGATTGIVNGTLICEASPDGLVWRLMSGNGGDNPDATGPAGNMPEGNPPTQSGNLGDACDTDGALSFGLGMVLVCADGKVRFATRDDMPPVPAGGYTQRPDWYPTLSQIFRADTAACPGGAVQLTHEIVPAAQLAPSIPMGWMVGYHVTPIDHAYIGLLSLTTPEAERTDADWVPVTAPADGTIIEASVLGGDTSTHRVVIAHGCDIVTVYMVLNRLTGVLAPYADQVDTEGYVRLSVPLKAGDEFGQQRDNPLDFNVFDGNTWLRGFANPFSYADFEAWKPYTADPFPLFVDEVRRPMEAVMQRLVEPRFGTIDHDVVGTASGSWFLDGTLGYTGLAVDMVVAATSPLRPGSVDGKNDYAYGHLALAPHPVDPSTWIFSTGWWADPAGDAQQWVIVPADGQPTPDQITASSGVVVYRLASIRVIQPPGSTFTGQGMSPNGIGYTVEPGDTMGWVVVQVVDDDTLTIEVVADPGRPPTGFTAAPRTYHR